MQSSCKSGLIIESQHIHHVLTASQVFQLTLVLLVKRSSNKKRFSHNILVCNTSPDSASTTFCFEIR